MDLQDHSRHKTNHKVRESIALDHNTHRNNDSGGEEQTEGKFEVWRFYFFLMIF